MSSDGINQTVESVLLQDSVFTETEKGIVTSYEAEKTLVINNINFINCIIAIVNLSGTTILAEGFKIIF